MTVRVALFANHDSAQIAEIATQVAELGAEVGADPVVGEPVAVVRVEQEAVDPVLELAAAPADPGERLRLLVELAATKRGIAVPPEEPEDDDIIDPYRRSDEVYEESAAQLVPAVQSIISSAMRAVSGAARE